MNKPTTLTTIQTIKEAEEHRRVTFSETPHDKNSILQAVPYWSLEEDVTQTLLAVFESELEEIKIDVKTSGKCETYTDGILEGTKQENERLRSHLTEVINYLRQK